MSGSVGTPDTNPGGNADGVNTSGYEAGSGANPGQTPAVDSGSLEAVRSGAPGNQWQPQPNTLGLGSLTAVPAGTTNGAALAAPPPGTTRVRFYIPAAASVSYTIQKVQPVAAPPAVVVPGNATGGNTLMVDDVLASGALVFVTALTGAVTYRYL